MKVIRKIRQEADTFVPDVLSKVMDRVGYFQPETIKRTPFWTFRRFAVLGAGAMVVLAGVTAPIFANNAVVSNASTYVELTITPASVYNQTAVKGTPTFAYRVDKNLKTKPIANDGVNALYAKNDDAKIILAGIGPSNTADRSVSDMAITIVEKAASAGYIELAGVGNVVTIAATGRNAKYCSAVKEEVSADILDYFRNRMIYGMVATDTATAVSLNGYDESTDANVDEYEDDYETSEDEHGDDDKGRGSDWGNGYDDWMTDHNHDDHGKHGNDKDGSTSSMDSSDHGGYWWDSHGKPQE